MHLFFNPDNAPVLYKILRYSLDKKNLIIYFFIVHQNVDSILAHQYDDYVNSDQ
jgi:hypothetical protein